jgi:3-hydroxyacyl-[acyl-carrier-protein] dehydratase
MHIETNQNSLFASIISKLPYGKDFLFVDEIQYIDKDKIIGTYKFDSLAYFYNSHFLHKPITPGVILIEAMGQIGMVSHLIFLNELHLSNKNFMPLFSNLESSFYKIVERGEKIKVIGDKIYFRNNVLKSEIKLYNKLEELCVVCKAQLSLKYE